jgi:hypothetical protein
VSSLSHTREKLYRPSTGYSPSFEVLIAPLRWRLGDLEIGPAEQVTSHSLPAGCSRHRERESERKKKGQRNPILFSQLALRSRAESSHSLLSSIRNTPSDEPVSPPFHTIFKEKHTLPHFTWLLILLFDLKIHTVPPLISINLANSALRRSYTIRSLVASSHTFPL